MAAIDDGPAARYPRAGWGMGDGAVGGTMKRGTMTSRTHGGTEWRWRTVAESRMDQGTVNLFGYKL